MNLRFTCNTQSVLAFLLMIKSRANQAPGLLPLRSLRLCARNLQSWESKDEGRRVEGRGHNPQSSAPHMMSNPCVLCDSVREISSHGSRRSKVEGRKSKVEGNPQSSILHMMSNPCVLCVFAREISSHGSRRSIVDSRGKKSAIYNLQSAISEGRGSSDERRRHMLEARKLGVAGMPHCKFSTEPFLDEAD